MRTWFGRLVRFSFCAPICLTAAVGISRAESPAEAVLFPPDGYIRLVNGTFTVLQPTPPPTPSQPLLPPNPNQPEISSPSSLGDRGRSFPSFGEIEAALTAGGFGAAPAGAPSESISPQNQSNPVADLGGALQQSDNVQSLNTQLRNPVALDPRVRGYRFGQIYTQADGAMWVPIRQDLDTPLSMIDPTVVQTVEVVPGPYALQFGPGFSALNIVTAPTPRYNCFETHAALTTNYYGNGDQLNAVQRIYGGNQVAGFSILHGTHDGNPYLAGNRTKIPSPYNNEDLFAQFGFDIDADRHVEFRYLRQDQTNTQYPGQFFKTNFAVTQGFNLGYTDESIENPWSKLIAQGWYNIGKLQGATDPNEHVFNMVDRVNSALTANFIAGGQTPPVGGPVFKGTTNAGVFTTGGRVATVYGDQGERQLTVGTDARLVEQYINENFSFNSPTGQQAINTGLPRSYISDAGAFGEVVLPVSSYWTTTLGTRVDWIYSNVDGPIPAAYPPNFVGIPLAQSNVLYSFFLTNKVDLDENWTAKFGFGQAQRPPTVSERYADGAFLVVLQNGFTRLIGQPDLIPERNWQLDGNLSCKYENFRGRLSGYYSLIQNFSTFQSVPVTDPLGAQLLRSFATPLASLAGFEAYGERDLNANLTGFGSAMYVSGRDLTLQAPLTQIYPLEGRAGLRLHDPDGGNRWGIEFFARMVDQQNRLGTLRSGTSDDRVIVEQQNAGFTIANLRSYYNVSPRLNLVAGINNVFNRNYLEFLSVRYAANTMPSPPATTLPAAAVFSPGFTPYVGVTYIY